MPHAGARVEAASPPPAPPEAALGYDLQFSEERRPSLSPRGAGEEGRGYAETLLPLFRIAREEGQTVEEAQLTIGIACDLTASEARQKLQAEATRGLHDGADAADQQACRELLRFSSTGPGVAPATRIRAGPSEGAPSPWRADEARGEQPPTPPGLRQVLPTTPRPDARALFRSWWPASRSPPARTRPWPRPP